MLCENVVIFVKVIGCFGYQTRLEYKFVLRRISYGMSYLDFTVQLQLRSSYFTSSTKEAQKNRVQQPEIQTAIWTCKTELHSAIKMFV